MKWLYSIFRLFFCPHKWELYKEVKVYSGSDTEMPISLDKHCQCRRCGKFKIFKGSYIW